ncbi:hypothetical protein KP509_25G006800 [Ceratopteris richardii]|nr:hypothetical protein KP509_25G006800 [Ceratopteris richardii]
MKRERALAYAFSEQLRRCTPKQNNFVIDCKGDKNHWGWRWLERWMAARPWESSFPGLAREHVSIMNVMDYKLLSKHVNGEENDGGRDNSSPAKNISFVKKRSLSIPDSMLNNLENISSPSKTIPPHLHALSKLTSAGTHPNVVNNSTSPRSAALAFDASQPHLSSPFRLRVSLPTLSSLSSQKEPTISSFEDCGATMDKDRIVAEALKGSLEAFKGTSSDAKHMDSSKRTGCGVTTNVGSKSIGAAKCEKAIGSGKTAMSFKESEPEGKKREHGTKVSSQQQRNAISPVPGYMQSTESTKAKARPTGGPVPPNKQEGSLALANKRRSSPARSEQKTAVSGMDAEARTSSGSSQRLISNIRTSSSRALMTPVKEQYLHP